MTADPPEPLPSAPPEIVIGIGASAGGVGALQTLFRHTPADTRAAFVVVLHLSPEHESHLAAVLQTVTPLPVSTVADRQRLEAAHVYVIPPNASLTIEQDDVVVSPVTLPEERHAPVDVLFRTLAHTHGANAVGVVLSGTGANGSSGIKWIKEHGGLTLVQDPAEAEFPDMPRNSLATGLVDYALPVAAIPDAIFRYYARRATPRLSAEGGADDADAMRELLTLLRVRTGHDFSNYKQGTVLRRIARRMHVHSIPTIREYGRFLRDSPQEAGLLLSELLISVTSFFRDPAAYAVLEQRVIPELMAARRPPDYVRAWVAGCATGEEAFSVAMLLAEAVARLAAPPPVQVFGSDLDERAITIAREGVYSEADVADISEERLRRFFVREQARYRIRRELRELVLFAHHNVIRDPPFSHLDLIVCRNVLIYLDRAVQQRLLETFHFALRPGGYLFLGGAETTDAAGELFAPFDKGAHVFESRTVTTRLPSVITEVPLAGAPRVAGRAPAIRQAERLSPADLHQRLLEQYAPPSIVVNEEQQVVHISDSAGRYLVVPSGEPSRDLLRMLPTQLRADMRNALHQAIRDRASVEVPGVSIGPGDGRVSICVRPVLRDGDPPRGFLLILIEPDTGTAADEPRVQLTSPTGAPVGQLENELEHMKQQLSATVEQYESQVEEAKASNEELQAMNEELRSAAEELETSKEELQSVNEELTTVNQELKIKIDELATTNNDFQNFINSTEIGTIFLDRQMRVKLFTPRACDVFHLVDSDVGRPLAHIAHTLDYERLHQDTAVVLERLQTVEREVETAAGRWYLIRLIPYRTADDRIDGVVLTCVDITNRRLAEAKERSTAEHLRLLIDSAVDYAMFTMTPDGHVNFWNAGAERMFGYTSDEILGRDASILFTPEDRAAGVFANELARARTSGRALDERFHLRRDGTLLFCSGGTTALGNDASLGFAKIARDLTAPRAAADALAHAQSGVEQQVVLRTQDLHDEITRRASAQEHVTDLMHKLVTAQEEQRARIARDLHDQLGQQLTTLRLSLERLRERTAKHAPADDDELTRALDLLRRIDNDVDFLAWELRPAVLDDFGLTAALPRFVRDWSTHYGIPAEVRVVPTADATVPHDVEVTFYRIAQEALTNIVKHAHATRADVLLERRDGSLVLVVEDDGIGFDPAVPDRAQGIGLLGMRERAALVGATLEIESSPGNGTSVFLRAPIAPDARQRPS